MILHLFFIQAWMLFRLRLRLCTIDIEHWIGWNDLYRKIPPAVLKF